MKRIAQLEQTYMKNNHPNFKSGDTLKVHVRIIEGEKERIQIFQGVVIGRRGSGTGETFTVRKISSGIGVERVFPFYSPNIAKIELIRSGQVRRSKLYYLRELTGKSARIKELLTDQVKSAKSKKEQGAKIADPAPETAVEKATEVKAEETAKVKIEKTKK